MALFERGLVSREVIDESEATGGASESTSSQGSLVSLGEMLAGATGRIAGESAFTLQDFLAAVTGSGLPGLRGAPERLRVAQLDAYLQLVIDRDLPEHGLAVRRPETLRRWLVAYAAASSTTASYSRILDMATAGDGAKPAKSTTNRLPRSPRPIVAPRPRSGMGPFPEPVHQVAAGPEASTG